MGTTTPNMSLYIPADGETNYGTPFANGMYNMDSHDHSGSPNNGVPISTAGLDDGAVTAVKLNADVFGVGVEPNAITNAIDVAGVLKPIFNLASNGLIVRTSGTTAVVRSIAVGATNRMKAVVFPDGVGGNPVLDVADTPDLEGVNNSGGSFDFEIVGVAQATLTSGLIDLSPNDTAIRTFSLTTAGIPTMTTIAVRTIDPNQSWLITAYPLGVAGTPSAMAMANFNATDLSVASIFSTPETVLAGSGTDVTLSNNNAGTVAYVVTGIRLS